MKKRFVSRMSYLVSRVCEIRFTRYASRQMLALFGLVVLIGCAGGQQELARLRSQGSVLDQRVVQLERAQ